MVSAVQGETYCRRIDAADYKMFETRLNENFETYCSTIVHCGHGQILQCQRGLTSESCTSNLTEIQISA